MNGITDIKKRKLRAMSFLSKKDNYRLKFCNRGLEVEYRLEHFGKYGYSSQGEYNMWKVIDSVFLRVKE